MRGILTSRVSRLALGLAGCLVLAPAASAGELPPMAKGLNGYKVSDPLLTIGEVINGYQPPGILDGLGAIRLNRKTVRVFANHELLNFRGYPYTITQGTADTSDDFTLTGARVSYFDIDRKTREIVDAGLAYNRIYDANGDLATDSSFLVSPNQGLSRLCSSALFEAGEFNRRRGKNRWRPNRGLEDDIYFTGEEDGGQFNPVGGAEWALDVHSGELWQVPAMGRGAWENVTQVDTGNTTHVAFILADDSSPFNFDGDTSTGDPGDPDDPNDNGNEAVPLYLYVGKKDPKSSDFLTRNGLSNGKLYVWVSDSEETKPSQFNTNGTLNGTWVQIDNSQDTSQASEDGSSGFDEYGYPTQSNLVTQATAKGAFGFSRPEDVSYNPYDASEIVLASTGVDTYDVDSGPSGSGNGADTFGTLYLVDTDFSDFSNLTATVTILYDGDADPSRTLRSPDNLDWADDGYIYVQEDEAEEDTLSGDEALFKNDPPQGQPFVANLNEAGILRINPRSGKLLRVANIDRSVVLDASVADPTKAVDTDAGKGGEWESSGILDVSRLFGEEGGTLFLFDVQAHGIEDQPTSGGDPNSLIFDAGEGSLVEGGQLLFLERGDDDDDDENEKDDEDDDDEDDD